MKNYMKKIIVGFFALAFLATGNSAFASGWNNYPSDCPTPLTIGNYTTGDGIQNGSNGCWTKTSISANQGETINIAVYYDNTNGSSAANSVIHLTQSPAGSMSSAHSTYTFSGSLTSSVGPLNLSQVTANLTSAQTLTFGQAKWFKAGSNSGISLPNGQTGYEAFNGGLSLGTIANGDWGTVLFSFSVGSGGSTPVNNCTISNFTINGSSSTTISEGGSANLVWNTENCTSVNVSGPNFNSTNHDGNQTVYPNNSGSYTITAYGNNGSAPSRTVYVNVNNQTYDNCTISNFTINGSSSTTISEGESVRLVWNTNDCTSVDVSGPNFSSTSLDGNRTTYPDYSGTYRITAHGNNGSAPSRTVYVNVDEDNQPVYNCTISSFYASPNTITSGQPVTLTWNTNNCTSVSISGIGSNLPLSYSQTVYPAYTTTYTLNAYGQNGNPSRTVQVNVNPTVVVPPPVYNACAVTTVATNVTRNSATLNGLITNSSGGSSYFEYGTSVNLGSRTVARSVNGSFNEVVTGLSSDTIYFFRAVSTCGGATSYGKIEIFNTLGTVVERPVIIQGTTVVGTQSPIMLKIENRYQYIGLGDIVDYTVTYKNIGKTILRKPVLQVVVPKGITLTNASRGTYSTDTNTLTVPLEDLLPNVEGIVYLQGRVDAIQVGTAQIVTTAILVYTSPNGAQENAIAYVLNNPRDINPNLLGASAFFGNFLGMSLIGWLILIILILLIVLIVRSYYRRSAVHVTTPSGSTTTTTHY
jgi:hypothetical protein